MEKLRDDIFSLKILPLFGMAQMFDDLVEAIRFVKGQPDKTIRSAKPLVKIEIAVRYKTGMNIHAECTNKVEAEGFLQKIRDGIL